jgi:dethiobiotin synthetase
MVGGLFVTGTDTGVGKTVVASALVGAFRERGLDVVGMKPVETGCLRRGPELEPADGAMLREASGGEEPLSAICPLRFAHPLAPLVAAELEGRTIEQGSLMRAVRELAARHDALVVEGVGGLLVPVAPGFSVADMAREAGFPLLVVTSAFLGTLNHTLLTVEHALGAGLSVAGVVLCLHRAPGGTLAEETNPAALRRLLPVPLLGVFPFLADLSPRSLAQGARDALDLDAVEKHLRAV